MTQRENIFCGKPSTNGGAGAHAVSQNDNVSPSGKLCVVGLKYDMSI